MEHRESAGEGPVNSTKSEVCSLYVDRIHVHVCIQMQLDDGNRIIIPQGNFKFCREHSLSVMLCYAANQVWVHCYCKDNLNHLEIKLYCCRTWN